MKPLDWDRNYVHSLEWLWLTEPLTPGPGESWINPTVDLVKGESMTPLERLFAVADCANGIGSKLDISKWTFLNTDLAVHVFRVPDGEWIGIRAETSYGPDGSARRSAHCSTSRAQSGRSRNRCWCGVARSESHDPARS